MDTMSQSSTSTDAVVTMADHAKHPTVRIVVGSKNQEYFLHRSLLSENSKYLDDHFNSLALRPTTVSLAECDPAIFDHFVNWIYHDTSMEQASDMMLVDTYVLAFKLDCRSLKDSVVFGLYTQLGREQPDINFLRYGLQTAPISSRLSEFLVKKTAYIMAGRFSMQWQMMYSIEGICDKLRAEVRTFKNADRPVDPCNEPAGRWYEPGDDKDWCLVDR